MNVHVTVPDDFVIKSNDLRTGSAPIGLGAVNVTLGGDLRATKARNQAVRLIGSVNTVRGTYQFQSRQFTILRDGSVRFNGDPIDRLNPELDIRTQRIIQGVGTLLGGQGCVTAGATNEYIVTVAWQGLAKTVAPASTCGQNDYGNDQLRRAISMRVQISTLSALAPPAP